MIRKYADRTEWGRIVEKKFTVVPKKTIGFSGTVTLFEMVKVKAPLYKQYEQDQEKVCIAADGYKWLQQFPELANYIVTAMYDDGDRLVQWVISICKCQGVLHNNIPWYDDLYLNIVILPGGQLYVTGQDRLDDAVRRDELGEEDVQLAWNTANLVMDEYRKGSFDMLLMSDKHLQEMLEE
ncbi:DUF402 domain-containing protein [Paenibacillus mesophilus]|uniref:DUF402 domain-containing protein n=1 Tax=Paenibacillus mesophilus TaxID=2582849 RepID=UPI00110D8B90|nr:DUF402 domain-containing protein [Paenibacillus mesophilus]TMV50304.1 DUF402 domain-containing protein [Paenibacillus mesophilus]